MEELKEEQNITDNENVPLVKKKRVINAPRSEKQIEAFKKAQQKRDENICQKKPSNLQCSLLLKRKKF